MDRPSNCAPRPSCHLPVFLRRDPARRRRQSPCHRPGRVVADGDPHNDLRRRRRARLARRPDTDWPHHLRRRQYRALVHAVGNRRRHPRWRFLHRWPDLARRHGDRSADAFARWLAVELSTGAANLADGRPGRHPVSRPCRPAADLGAPSMRSFLAAIVSRPWIYGFIVAFVMWIVTTAYSGLGSGGAVFSAAMEFAVFSVVVGTGQMLVIASGPGNIDLSIPS